MSNFRIQTYSGKLLDYLDPNPDDICIEDIAKALSQECRFGAQCGRFYSVAQHSYMVAAFSPIELKLEALLHDAEEAYIKDLPSPLILAISRGMVSQYKTIKKNVKLAIARKFNLDYYKWITKTFESDQHWTPYELIKEIDLKMAVTERNMLFKHPLPLQSNLDYVEPMPYNIKGFAPDMMIDAERKFLEFYELYRRDKEDASN